MNKRQTPSSKLQRNFTLQTSNAAVGAHLDTATNVARLVTETDRESVPARSGRARRGTSKSIPPCPCIGTRCEPRRPRGPVSVPRCGPSAGNVQSSFWLLAFDAFLEFEFL